MDFLTRVIPVTSTYGIQTRLLLCAALLSTSCGKDCPTNVSPGDRFRVTINGLEPGGRACSNMPLDAGTTFTASASAVQTWSASGGCRDYRGANTPEFLVDYAVTCEPANAPLGVDCQVILPDGCDAQVSTSIFDVPARGQTALEHATFAVTWTSSHDDAGTSCLHSDCGSDLYDVRIERLAPGTDQ